MKLSRLRAFGDSISLEDDYQKFCEDNQDNVTVLNSAYHFIELGEERIYWRLFEKYGDEYHLGGMEFVEVFIHSSLTQHYSVIQYLQGRIRTTVPIKGMTIKLEVE